MLTRCALGEGVYALSTQPVVNLWLDAEALALVVIRKQLQLYWLD